MKRPQVEWMLAELHGMLAAARAAGRPISRVVDVGGGRGDLALCVARLFPAVQVLHLLTPHTAHHIKRVIRE